MPVKSDIRTGMFERLKEWYQGRDRPDVGVDVDRELITTKGFVESHFLKSVCQSWGAERSGIHNFGGPDSRSRRLIAHHDIVDLGVWLMWLPHWFKVAKDRRVAGIALPRGIHDKSFITGESDSLG